MENLSSKEWEKRVEADSNAVILDVRTDDEFDEVRIPGAIQANILEPAAFMAKAEQLDKTKNYYVYCRSGGRSAQACAVLNSLGIQNTFNLAGGITDWEGPVE